MPKAVPSAEVSKFISSFTRKVSPTSMSSDDIVKRCLYPLVNEGFKILEEGIANDPGDIDVIYLYGYGWPAWRGEFHKTGVYILLFSYQFFLNRWLVHLT